MVIETFLPGRVAEIYARLAERGRRLPDGLAYIDSWVSADRSRCFQLMEAADEAPLREWTAKWSDLVAFEIVPVVTSRQARESPAGPTRRG